MRLTRRSLFGWLGGVAATGILAQGAARPGGWRSPTDGQAPPPAPLTGPSSQRYGPSSFGTLGLPRAPETTVTTQLSEYGSWIKLGDLVETTEVSPELQRASQQLGEAYGMSWAAAHGGQGVVWQPDPTDEVDLAQLVSLLGGSAA
jgi:hypothetical protein